MFKPALEHLKDYIRNSDYHVVEVVISNINPEERERLGYTRNGIKGLYDLALRNNCDLRMLGLLRKYLPLSNHKEVSYANIEEVWQKPGTAQLSKFYGGFLPADEITHEVFLLVRFLIAFVKPLQSLSLTIPVSMFSHKTIRHNYFHYYYILKFITPYFNLLPLKDNAEDILKISFDADDGAVALFAFMSLIPTMSHDCISKFMYSEWPRGLGFTVIERILKFKKYEIIKYLCFENKKKYRSTILNLFQQYISKEGLHHTDYICYLLCFNTKQAELYFNSPEYTYASIRKTFSCLTFLQIQTIPMLLENILASVLKACVNYGLNLNQIHALVQQIIPQNFGYRFERELFLPIAQSLTEVIPPTVSVQYSINHLLANLHIVDISSLSGSKYRVSPLGILTFGESLPPLKRELRCDALTLDSQLYAGRNVFFNLDSPRVTAGYNNSSLFRPSIVVGKQRFFPVICNSNNNNHGFWGSFAIYGNTQVSYPRLESEYCKIIMTGCMFGVTFWGFFYKDGKTIKLSLTQPGATDALDKDYKLVSMQVEYSPHIYEVLVIEQFREALPFLKQIMSATGEVIYGLPLAHYINYGIKYYCQGLFNGEQFDLFVNTVRKHGQWYELKLAEISKEFNIRIRCYTPLDELGFSRNMTPESIRSEVDKFRKNEYELTKSFVDRLSKMMSSAGKVYSNRTVLNASSITTLRELNYFDYRALLAVSKLDSQTPEKILAYYPGDETRILTEYGKVFSNDYTPLHAITYLSNFIPQKKESLQSKVFYANLEVDTLLRMVASGIIRLQNQLINELVQGNVGVYLNILKKIQEIVHTHVNLIATDSQQTHNSYHS